MTDAAVVLTDRFKGESPPPPPVDKSNTLLLEDLLDEEKKSDLGEDVPFVDNDALAPTGILVISTLSTIGADKKRSLLECFCPGVFLSIVNPKILIICTAIFYTFRDNIFI